MQFLVRLRLTENFNLCRLIPEVGLASLTGVSKGLSAEIGHHLELYHAAGEQGPESKRDESPGETEGGSPGA